MQESQSSFSMEQDASFSLNESQIQENFMTEQEQVHNEEIHNIEQEIKQKQVLQKVDASFERKQKCSNVEIQNQNQSVSYQFDASYEMKQEPNEVNKSINHSSEQINEEHINSQNMNILNQSVDQLQFDLVEQFLPAFNVAPLNHWDLEFDQTLQITMEDQRKDKIKISKLLNKLNLPLNQSNGALAQQTHKACMKIIKENKENKKDKELCQSDGGFAINLIDQHKQQYFSQQHAEIVSKWPNLLTFDISIGWFVPHQYIWQLFSHHSFSSLQKIYIQRRVKQTYSSLQTQLHVTKDQNDFYYLSQNGVSEQILYMHIEGNYLTEKMLRSILEMKWPKMKQLTIDFQHFISTQNMKLLIDYHLIAMPNAQVIIYYHGLPYKKLKQMLSELGEHLQTLLNYHQTIRILERKNENFYQETCKKSSQLSNIDPFKKNKSQAQKPSNKANNSFTVSSKQNTQSFIYEQSIEKIKISEQMNDDMMEEDFQIAKLDISQSSQSSQSSQASKSKNKNKMQQDASYTVSHISQSDLYHKYKLETNKQILKEFKYDLAEKQIDFTKVIGRIQKDDKFHEKIQEKKVCQKKQPQKSAQTQIDYSQICQHINYLFRLNIEIQDQKQLQQLMQDLSFKQKFDKYNESVNFIKYIKEFYPEIQDAQQFWNEDQENDNNDQAQWEQEQDDMQQDMGMEEQIQNKQKDQEQDIDVYILNFGSIRSFQNPFSQDYFTQVENWDRFLFTSLAINYMYHQPKLINKLFELEFSNLHHVIFSGVNYYETQLVQGASIGMRYLRPGEIKFNVLKFNSLNHQLKFLAFNGEEFPVYLADQFIHIDFNALQAVKFVFSQRIKNKVVKLLTATDFKNLKNPVCKVYINTPNGEFDYRFKKYYPQKVQFVGQTNPKEIPPSTIVEEDSGDQNWQ